MNVDIYQSARSYGNPLQVFADYDIRQTSTYRYRIHCGTDEVRRVKRKSVRHGYRVLAVYQDDMARSDDYRRKFFKMVPPDSNGYYRCRYCNKKLRDKSDIQVDHIFPIEKAKQMAGQRYLWRHGIENVNDIRNLCAACVKCNQAKKDKLGIWLWRGRMGRHKWYWALRDLIRLGFIGGVIYVAWAYWPVAEEWLSRWVIYLPTE